VNALRTALREGLDGLRTAATRVTPGPLLVRGAAFGFAVCALLIAVPADLLSSVPVAGVLVVLAAVPALAPRSRLTVVVILVAALGWIASTTSYGQPVTLPPLIALSCLLYLLHTTTALAAVLPYDTVIAPAVLVHWLARSAVVLAVTALFAVAAAMGVRVVGGQAYLVASVAGLLLVAALAGLLVALRRR
jgi:hypothetical protein